ncbi:Flp family type IVb pilin [Advenella sp. WQ 585]|uniref:Flp family type IVb pilin n=1 Tax=Advenella mandrilli TaxID=2800330 RepID=A0ABS1EEJ3_9BURK|nr:Flp family type IVb pilin [Advenella mandrilli]MBK1779965.1 Flp family type IVb pilin [Advenella mandrilli]
MKDQLVKFWKDEEGATAIEYALIAGLIAVAIITALGLLGGGLSNVFEGIQSKLSDLGAEIEGVELPSGDGGA